MAKIYDASGGVIDIGGGVQSSPEDFASIPNKYASLMRSAFSSLVNETDGNYNRIPFLAYTDQHGYWDDACQVMHCFNFYCDWSKLSAVYQLGDCTGNAGLARANAIIPLAKQINVIGNHDMQALNPLADHTSLHKYFRCGGNARQHNRNEWWTITDGLRNVKYIVINDLEMPAGERYTYWYMSTDQVRWFVEELEKADGYDVIILTHCNFDDDLTTAVKRNGTAHNRPSGQWPWTYDTNQNASFHALIAARKQKQSGTYTDKDGNMVPYDFTGCNSELLIAFHGHDHVESYQHMQGSITSYVFECFYPGEGTGRTIYLGYLDRAAKRLKTWKLYDGITAADVQEIDIN